MNSNSNSNIGEGSKVESCFDKSIKFILYKYRKVFERFINYEDKPFESEILLNQCIYNFNIGHLLSYLSYNIRSTFLYAKDTMYLMFLLNRNMNIVLKYLINSLLFAVLFFALLFILSVLISVYTVIGIISFILFIITFPFRFLFGRNKKSNENKNNKNSKNGKNNRNERINKKINRKLNRELSKGYRIIRIKKSIKQQIILKLVGNYENTKVKRLSKIKAIFLKLLDGINAVFIKLNKQLQIKFIDKKVTSYNKHVTKGLRNRTKLIADALGKRDFEKESLFAKKYYLIKAVSSMVKSLDKTSSCLKSKDKEKLKEAKDLVVKEFKKELKTEKEKFRKTKINLNKTKLEVRSKVFDGKVKTSEKSKKVDDKSKGLDTEEIVESRNEGIEKTKCSMKLFFLNKQFKTYQKWKNRS